MSIYILKIITYKFYRKIMHLCT